MVHIQLERPLTVLMPVYKTPRDWLQTAITSILNQSFDNFYFFIVDDGSESELIDELINSFARRDSRVVYFKNAKNKGLVATLNSAIENISTPWIARMDSDDQAFKNRLARQIDCARSTFKKVDVVGTSIQIMAKRTVTILPGTHSQIKATMPWRCCIAHPTVMIRTKMIRDVGGYPDVKNAEDYALWTKLLLQSNARFENIQEPLLNYRVVEGREKYFQVQEENTFNVQNEWFKWAGLSEEQFNVWKNIKMGNVSPKQFLKIRDAIIKMESNLSNFGVLSSDATKVARKTIRQAMKKIDDPWFKLYWGIRHLLHLTV